MTRQPEIVTVTQRYTVYCTRVADGTLTIYECQGVGDDGNEYLFNQSVIIRNGFKDVGEPYRLIRIRGRHQKC